VGLRFQLALLRFWLERPSAAIQTQKFDTLWRRPVSTSRGVRSSPALGDRFRTWTKEARASAHSSFSATASSSAARTRSIIVQLTLSAFPFCCALYGVFLSCDSITAFQASERDPLPVTRGSADPENRSVRF